MLMVEKKNQGNKSGMTAVKGSHSVLFGSTISAELGVYFEFRTASETVSGIKLHSLVYVGTTFFLLNI
jgi:hypothetical protein